MKIYLLRHEVTSWNREGRLQGITDVPVSTVGACKSHQLAQQFKNAGLVAVFASPLARP
jgi:broad specificity phosphatase PhoE